MAQVNKIMPKKRPMDWTAIVAWLLLIVVIGASAYGISLRRPGTTTVWVSTRDLPVYHLINDSDVATTTVALSDLSADFIPAGVSPIAYYTCQSLVAGKAIRLSQLVFPTDTALARGTVPVSIPATQAMAFNGQLSPGAVITIWSMARSGESSPYTAQPLLQRVLVLDVQRVVPEPGKEQEASNPPYVIILAIPIDRQADVLAASARGSLALTLTP